MSKPTKPLSETIIEYHRARAEFLIGAGALRSAISAMQTARDLVNSRRATLLEISREIGPRLHADCSGVIGGAKVDDVALDALIADARKALGELTQYEERRVSAAAAAAAE